MTVTDTDPERTVLVRAASPASSPTGGAADAELTAATPPEPLAVAGGTVELEDLSPRGGHRRSIGQWRGRVLRVLVPVLLIALWQLSSVLGWTS